MPDEWKKSPSVHHTLQLNGDNLGHKFGRLVLFRGLLFVLQAGQTLAITGPNGSGKTTLLRIIAGLLKPEAGSILFRIDNKIISPEIRVFQTGLVATYLNLYDGFTARENLAFIARLRCLTDAAERVDNTLKEVGMEARARDLYGTLSSGLKQRLKFAAACLSDPSLLLIDEPSTNLDSEGLLIVERIVNEYRNRGRIVIIATNNQPEANNYDLQICLTDYL